MAKIPSSPQTRGKGCPGVGVYLGRGEGVPRADVGGHGRGPPYCPSPSHLGLWYSGLRGSAGKVLKSASGRMVR